MKNKKEEILVCNLWSIEARVVFSSRYTTHGALNRPLRITKYKEPEIIKGYILTFDNMNPITDTQRMECKAREKVTAILLINDDSIERVDIIRCDREYEIDNNNFLRVTQTPLGFIKTLLPSQIEEKKGKKK